MAVHPAAEARASHAALVERSSAAAADVRRLEIAARELEHRLETSQADIALMHQQRDRLLAAVVEAQREMDAGVALLDELRTAMRESDAAVQAIRTKAATLVKETNRDPDFSDANHIIPTFILTRLPVGLIGLLIVAIIMAATDSIAAELNSLSTATVIDFYKRWFQPTATDAHYLLVSKIATGLWGLFASAVAVWAAQLGSLIEVVNKFGSFFYGSILGVFILAVAFRQATGTGAFVGLIAGMSSVAWVATFTKVAFLWQNVVGAVAVVIVGVIVSAIERRIRPSFPA